KMPITRRSAPSATTAPIRCSANVAIAASKVAPGSIVTTSLPFLDTIVLTVIGRLPPPATILPRGVPVFQQHKELGSSSTASSGAPTLGTICVLMQRRFAALRYFTPLAVDGFGRFNCESRCPSNDLQALEA